MVRSMRRRSLSILGLYVERTGDEAMLRELWPAAEKALAWIEIRSGDPDGDGFLEYSGSSAEGAERPKGSRGSKILDAVFHADGELAHGPVALCEVQGYAYAAKRSAAICARRLGRSDTADRLDRAADRLAQRFEEAFWCEQIGLYHQWRSMERKGRAAFAHPMRVISCGRASLRPDRARRVADAMISSKFFRLGRANPRQGRGAIQSEVLS